jgi:beta-lactam-binding protein with PASTA domain
MQILNAATAASIGLNRPASHILRSLMGCLGILLLAACGGGGGGSGTGGASASGPSQVDDPNVQGDTQAAATAAIAAAGLTVGTITMQASGTVPAGDVISESPVAGTAAASGSVVNLIVSSGPASVSVPNVVGDTQATATAAITGAGLVAGTVTTQSSATVATGDIISESPAAGTSVSNGSTVNLVVSSGPAAVSVPNVVSDTQAAATTTITGAGLVVGSVTMQSSATVVAGNIISESPSAGTSVAGGSAVNLVVAGSSSSGGYTVGGTVTGLPIAQLSALVLSDGITATSPTASTCVGFCSPGSPFVFSGLPTGTQYTVAVVTQPSGETCSITQGATGTIGTSTITNVAISCLAGSWTLLSTMPVPRGFMAVTVLNNLIYAIGGVSNAFTSNQTCYNSVTVYDPSTDTWSFAAPYPIAGFGMGATTINGTIYVFGGTNCQNNNASLANAYAYDPTANSWTPVASMPNGPLTNVGVGTDGTSAYLFGGLNATSLDYSPTIQVYDPSANTWTSPSFSLPFFASAGVVWVSDGSGGGSFLIVPGYFQGTPLSTEYQYFPAENVGLSDSLPFATEFPAAAIIDSTVYTAVANYASAPQFYKGGTQLAPPTVQQIGASAAVVNEVFYLIGGFQQSQTGPGIGAVEAYQP